MPFFDHVGPEPDDYDTSPKQDVRLTQLGSASTKTSFTCGDAFGWANRTPGVPDLDSRVALDTSTDLASIPPFLWGLIASYGRHTMPAILHDVRCDASKAAAGNGGRARTAYLRRHADHQFRHTLKAHADQGVVTRYIMWCAVRLFGFRPLGVAVLAGIIVSMLHQSSNVFVSVSDLLNKVTIWPWLSWLDWVPQGIAWGLAQLATALRPNQPYTGIMIAVATISLVALVYRSFERPAAGGPVRFSLPALLSLVGAGVVGVLTAPPVLPLVVVTMVTRFVLWLLDFVMHWLDLAWTKVLRLIDGATPSNVTVPEGAMLPAAVPPFPGFFPTP
ncbi:DUF1353 domain-containing protein [Nostocoides sp. HKS02]|uniref:DUF1353 domain-containing protein n=1 Tax=Nostocoides sp. HKS02 TaxID=1813880 RepID=UPI0012B46165|nr:DUF1353 domain-containing protein [Tetrasphaera sp. HKS02]QGN57481.1 DUF1353 domain-containing protein [Tetrasphaera sp. HKS02]